MLVVISPVVNICEIIDDIRNILTVRESWFEIVVDAISCCNHGILAHKSRPRRIWDLPTQLSGAHEYIILGHRFIQTSVANDSTASEVRASLTQEKCSF
jgi:hypothetical protein